MDRGHPYLTQRLCRAIVDATVATPHSGTARSAVIRTRQFVDALCVDLFLSPRAQERDDNLLFVRERLLKSEVDLASLLDLYGQVRRGKGVRDDETNPLVTMLRLSGVTRVTQGALQLRNRIYTQVFDARWIARSMPDAELRRQRVAYRKGLLRTAAVSVVILGLVMGLAIAALMQARRAEERERTGRRNLYAAQMSLAQEAWDLGNFDRLKELLDAQVPRGTEEDLRGFEWRYLWRLARRDNTLATIPAHDNVVSSVAFSPDGKTLASASHDWIVKLWDVRSRREAPPSGARWSGTLRGHTGFVYQVLFSPDGKMLASFSDDETVRLWDVATRKCVATFRASVDVGGNPGNIAFSPDGRLLATSDGASIRLWDVASRRAAGSFSASQGWHSLAFSPVGGVLAVGGFATPVKLWQILTKRPIASLEGFREGTYSVGFSPDGKTLATGSDVSGKVKIWDVGTRKMLATLVGRGSEVGSLAFSPDGKLLATAGGTIPFSSGRRPPGTRSPL